MDAQTQPAKNVTGEEVLGECAMHASHTLLLLQEVPDDIKVFIRTMLVVYGRHEVWVCHGITTLTSGKKGFHAWIEIGDSVVLDCGSLKMKHSLVPKSVYYEIGGIDEKDVFRYTEQKLCELLVVHETYGPWENTLLNVQEMK